MTNDNTATKPTGSFSKTDETAKDIAAKNEATKTEEKAGPSLKIKNNE